MLTIGIIFGGRSGEHDVSRCSAASVYEHLDRDKYNIIAIGIDRDGKWYPDSDPKVFDDDVFGKSLRIKKQGNWFFNTYPDNNQITFFERSNNFEVKIDLAFPVIHGTFCEDGKLQGILESCSIPYVGADVLGSAIGMDKDVSKRLLDQGGIDVVPWVTAFKNSWQENKHVVKKEIEQKFGYPCFVKPANAGSSVGIYQIKSSSEFDEKIEKAFDYDTKILIEKAINCREIEFAVLGNYNLRCSVAGEIKPHGEFYSYDAKYVDDAGADLNIPAEIDNACMDHMSKLAIKAYQLLCLKGLCRIDFFLDKENQNIYLNEVNTLPGFTSISMYPKLWEHELLMYSELLDILIDLALRDFEYKSAIKTTF